jgi:hypothetical protein
MYIRIAFYKGRGSWHNRLISWWTKSPYSHAELILPDGITWISISPFVNCKVTARPKVDYASDEWDFISFEITAQQHKTILKFYDQTAGCGYDWFGMFLSQFLPFHIKQRNRWYCSEWIAYALMLSDIISWQKKAIFECSDLSPGFLYNMLQDNCSTLKEPPSCSDYIH